MPLRRLKLGLAFSHIFLKRQFKALSNPLQPTPLRVAVLGFLGVLIGLFFIWQFRDQLFHSDLRQGIIGIYEENEYPAPLTNLLSKGLFKVNGSSQIIPDLAKSIEQNREGTEFVVKLRDDLYWVDQTPVKSSEIQFNFPGAEVNYPDEKTIQFKLNEPFTPFPSLLTKPIYKNGTLTGVGPYVSYPAKDVPKGQFLIKKVILRTTDASLPDLTVFMYPAENLAKQALKMGEIQSILGINDIEEYKNAPNFQLYSKLNQTQLVAVFYNTKDPVMSDENFRLALSYAAPSIEGETEAKTSIPNSSWAFNNEVKDFLDNPEQAKAALKKVQKGKEETVTLTTTNYLRSVGEKVVKAWNNNGIKARVKVESGIPQNFQALLISQNIPVDPDQYSLWHSTQSNTNLTKISNPRIDKDLEDGRKATDSAKRKAAYQDFQKVLLDQSPATFLYFPKINVVYNKKIGDQLMKVLNLQLGR